ncbi:uncharacterized protein FA14DRAFT_185746 [Meira miltonrushii]|uniref:BZIP domain-containing protein n=1 Tax=Meira miltonrushii TaxID=1280837 RepID=A0A316V5S1_9BASI|nr:uncharacterized protein FA14DRAFT_185746 [Meira miltonrushii]PWN32910.1 hypothetical protein FA14DRAFT_185746 [Meira miltonrushii]
MLSFHRSFLFLIFMNYGVRIVPCLPIAIDQPFLARRQVREEGSKPIDLNKEPSPEVIIQTTTSALTSPASVPITASDSRQTVPDPAVSVIPGSAQSRYKLTRKYERMNIPPGLNEEEKRRFRIDVKNERRRKRRKEVKASTDESVRSIIRERAEQAVARQTAQRRRDRAHVNVGLGTPEQEARVAKKREKDRLYNRMLAVSSFLVLASILHNTVTATPTILDKKSQFKFSSPTAFVQIFRRQVRDDKGRLIDLNKEATPEPDLPVSHGQDSSTVPNLEHSTTLSLYSPMLGGSKETSRYSFPRAYKKIHVPEGLTAEEVKEFRSKVKNERRREATKKARTSTDPAVRKIMNERRERNLVTQRKYDRNMRLRVNYGVGTENEKRIIAKKRAACQRYYHVVRKPKKEAQRQAHIQLPEPNASTSENRG